MNARELLICYYCQHMIGLPIVFLLLLRGVLLWLGSAYLFVDVDVRAVVLLLRSRGALQFLLVNCTFLCTVCADKCVHADYVCYVADACLVCARASCAHRHAPCHQTSLVQRSMPFGALDMRTLVCRMGAYLVGKHQVPGVACLCPWAMLACLNLLCALFSCGTCKPLNA